MRFDNHQTQIDSDGHSEMVISDALVLRQKIATGRYGTVVYEGTYLGRPAAVKRFVKGFHDFVEREERVLRASDHSNIIRLYGREEDEDFIYFVLEPCDCGLSELVEKHPELWSYPNGFPSSGLLMLIRGIVAGLAHLHSVGFVHPDLKPSDVLTVGLCSKLSGMGYCINLADDELLSRHDDTAYDDVDDIPDSDDDDIPDVDDISDSVLVTEPTRAIDMFSLGLVIYFCLTQGGRLLCGPSDLVYEAEELIRYLSYYQLEARPKASEVVLHPLFWDSKRRLLFMKDASDFVEVKKSESLFQELENIRVLVFQKDGWQYKVDENFLNEMGLKKKYNYKKVKDLIRIVRHAVHHYNTLSTNLQNLLGPMPEGVDLYFRKRYPSLLMEVYNVMHCHCKNEEWFGKYMDMVYLYG